MAYFWPHGQKLRNISEAIQQKLGLASRALPSQFPVIAVAGRVFAYWFWGRLDEVGKLIVLPVWEKDCGFGVPGDVVGDRKRAASASPNGPKLLHECYFFIIISRFRKRAASSWATSS